MKKLKTKCMVRRLTVILNLAVLFCSMFCTTALAQSALYDAPQIGESAPDFAVQDIEGKTTNLSDFLGRPVVINFWATWCSPCGRELPAFEKLFREYGGEIAFLMVDLADGQRDTPEIAKAFADKNHYTFPLLFDTEFDAAYAYQVFSIPKTITVDAEGKICFIYVGAMQEESLRSEIEALLEH